MNIWDLILCISLTLIVGQRPISWLLSYFKIEININEQHHDFIIMFITILAFIAIFNSSLDQLIQFKSRPISRP